MVESASSTNEGRTLIVFLCMHRSGSSMASNLFQRLGMSLGPFELLGATEHNKYGHFESVPMFLLNREVQNRVFGFQDDLPDSPEVMRRFRESGGDWELTSVPLPEELFEQGRALIEQLVETGLISGFKDPRVPLLWPFWSRVLAGFPDLHVIPVFLARSPHEIAMSIFMRGKGNMDYNDALDAAAVHYRQLKIIFDQWEGPKSVVRFDPRTFTEDLRKAADVCGLRWNDAIFAEVYDATCKHHEPASVAHVSEEYFRQLGGTSAGEGGLANLEQLARDAATRETVMRRRISEQSAEMQGLRLDALQERQKGELKEAEYEAKVLDFLAREQEYRSELAEVENRLAQITSTRTWQLHERIVRTPGVKWLSDALRPSRGPKEGI
jgi:hypothetical protein